MMQREPLSIVDSAWLRLDRPTNLMMICGVMLFSERLALPTVRQTIRSRLLCFHRFRQRIVQHDGAAFWETDPEFDPDWHVRRIALPGAAGPAELQEITSDLISTPLDPSKPMWQFHVIDTAGRGSALVLRIHHCYGDGFALAHVIASLTDAGPEQGGAPARDLGAHAGAASHSSWQRMLGPLTVALADAARTASTLMATLTTSAGDWITHPSRAADLARAGLDLAGELAFIANMDPDSPTCLKGPLGVMKRVAWAETLSLFELQAVAEAHACSVNDVLLSCAAAALRSHLIEQGEEVATLQLRAMVPVNLRPPGPVDALGNRFGLVILSLPMAETDPVERLLEVHRRMQELKNSRQAMATLAILAGIGLAPEAIREQAVATLAANASAVITNVRGAPQARYFAGERIARQLFWVPQSGGIGVGISLLSYAGQVNVGIVTDVKLVPDPAQLASRFQREFDALLLTSLMMRWD